MRDRFEGWTFDEDFVRAGQPEPSAAERALDPPLLIAGAARERRRRQERPAGTSRGGAHVWVVVATFALLAIVVLLQMGKLGGAYGAGASSEPVNPATPIGTCFVSTYAVMPQMQSAQVAMRESSCTSLHQYELVSLQLLPADQANYPDMGYWEGTLLASCRADFAQYAGVRDGSATVRGAYASYLKPSSAEWASGDRDAYCVARSSPAQRGSVAH